jgi:hypothetical protein
MHLCNAEAIFEILLGVKLFVGVPFGFRTIDLYNAIKGEYDGIGLLS